MYEDDVEGVSKQLAAELVLEGLTPRLFRNALICFFDRSSLVDEWELSFIRSYNPFRFSIAKVAKDDPAVREMVEVLMTLTKASARCTGRAQTLFREAAWKTFEGLEIVSRQ